MAKLPAVKPRQGVRFLEQNGFVLDHTSGSHFVFFHPTSRHRAVSRS
jgi:predicted RNA binding protein YcfA (HicA-like mRNA interferase family)